MLPRPISVTLVACLLILAGAVGVVYHLRELDLHHPFANDTLLIEFVRLLAIVAGIFLLRGRNWARWLAMIWITLHVILSFWHSWTQVAMHAVILLVFALLLFDPRANAWFQVRRT